MDNEYCFVCGKPATCNHHLLFGRGIRSLADQDHLYLPICDYCHTRHILRTGRIHDNEMAESLSKIIGQLMYEINEMEAGSSRQEAKDKFLQRYGRLYV